MSSPLWVDFIAGYIGGAAGVIVGHWISKSQKVYLKYVKT